LAACLLTCIAFLACWYGTTTTTHALDVMHQQQRLRKEDQTEFRTQLGFVVRREKKEEIMGMCVKKYLNKAKEEELYHGNSIIFHHAKKLIPNLHFLKIL
jgi:hypothetical protein